MFGQLIQWPQPVLPLGQCQQHVDGGGPRPASVFTGLTLNCGSTSLGLTFLSVVKWGLKVLHHRVSVRKCICNRTTTLPCARRSCSAVESQGRGSELSLKGASCFRGAAACPGSTFHPPTAVLLCQGWGSAGWATKFWVGCKAKFSSWLIRRTTHIFISSLIVCLSDSCFCCF